MNKRLDSKGCELKKARGKMRGKKDRHEAFGKNTSCSKKTRPVEASLPYLNVTQVAVHKERWREERKKKIIIIIVKTHLQ